MRTGSRIIIETHAYNAESTIRRCIDSVLNQTHENFEYYLLDNGSTDKTGEIIREYAQKDERIKAFYFEKNHIGKWFSEYLMPIRYNPELRDCWFASLSADDEYDVRFFEKMLNFCKKNNLLLASCCSDPIDEITKENLAKAKLENDIIIKDHDFSERFPEYYRYFGTMWAKLISFKVYSKIVDEKTLKRSGTKYKLPYFAHDTDRILVLLNDLPRTGVLSEVLHKRYMADTSLIANPIAIKTASGNAGIVEIMKSFLLYKCNFISEKNEIFIYQTYYRATKLYLERLFASKNTNAEKITDMIIAFDVNEMRDLFSRNYIEYEQKIQLIKKVLDFIVNLSSEEKNSDNTIHLKEIIDSYWNALCI